MAQRKSPPAGKPSGSGRAGASSSRPGTKPGNSSRAPSISTVKSPSGGKGPATRPPARKNPNNKRTIVNQKQTPWGLIATTVAVVLFAAAVVVIVIATHKSNNGTSSSNGTNAADPYRQPELAGAAKISGLTYKVEANHTHETGRVTYDSAPPRGGNHNGFWADCSGTVYNQPIANENAVHMLEHGAVWITYNATEINGAALKELQGFVSGVDRMALSPYPNLDSPISLQAWGYQLKVKSADDPRIPQFIGLLKNNKKTTPEYGSSCSNPGFKAHPSTFGHPTSS
ncbi:MAG: DUF3105 domain-containing protein [Actinomycetota bacterium]|nr:DUF3105 domain-containing protein [Actinomycetota bacterium]